MGGDLALQDGGSSYSPTSTETGGLASQGELERYLFHGTNAFRPSGLPEVHCRGSSLPFHQPPIQTT